MPVARLLAAGQREVIVPADRGGGIARGQLARNRARDRRRRLRPAPPARRRFPGRNRPAKSPAGALRRRKADGNLRIPDTSYPAKVRGEPAREARSKPNRWSTAWASMLADQWLLPAMPTSSATGPVGRVSMCRVCSGGLGGQCWSGVPSTLERAQVQSPPASSQIWCANRSSCSAKRTRTRPAVSNSSLPPVVLLLAKWVLLGCGPTRPLASEGRHPESHRCCHRARFGNCPRNSRCACP